MWKNSHTELTSGAVYLGDQWPFATMIEELLKFCINWTWVVAESEMTWNNRRDGNHTKPMGHMEQSSWWCSSEICFSPASRCIHVFAQSQTCQLFSGKLAIFKWSLRQRCTKRTIFFWWSDFGSCIAGRCHFVSFNVPPFCHLENTKGKLDFCCSTILPNSE